MLHIYAFFRVQALPSVPRMLGTTGQPVLLCSLPWGRQHSFRTMGQYRPSLVLSFFWSNRMEGRGEDWRGEGEDWRGEDMEGRGLEGKIL